MAQSVSSRGTCPDTYTDAVDSTRARDTDLFQRDQVDPGDGSSGGSGRDDWDDSRADGGSPRREKRRNRKVLVAALVLLLVPVLAVGGYLAWLNHIVTNNVKQELLLPDDRSAGRPPRR